MKGRENMDYQQATNKLGGKTSRKVGNNTYLQMISRKGIGNVVALRLHATEILTWTPDGAVTLNSGGWQTVTTKARMNEYLPAGRVTQSKGIWHLTVGGREYDYRDGMRILADGGVEVSE